MTAYTAVVLASLVSVTSVMLVGMLVIFLKEAHEELAEMRMESASYRQQIVQEKCTNDELSVRIRAYERGATLTDLVDQARATPDTPVTIMIGCEELYTLGVLDIPPHVTLTWPRRGPAFRVFNADSSVFVRDGGGL